MLINMVLKTDELKSPQEVKRPSFVKISRAGKNGSMRNLLCFGGTTQCPRTTLRNWVEAFKTTEPQVMVLSLTGVLKNTGPAKTLFFSEYGFLAALLEPCGLLRVNSSPNSALHVKHKVDRCQEDLSQRPMEDFLSLNSVYEHFHFNVIEK